MALSNGNASFSGPIIFLNARSKDEAGKPCAPHFQIAKVGEDKKIHATKETCTQIEGDLLRPHFKTRDYEGQPIKHVVLYVTDKEKNETYSLDLTHRIASRSLFNGILSLTSPAKVSISIYENKGGYEAMSLWQDGKLVPWKFDGRKGEIPEAIEGPKFKGKRQFDYDPVDSFFENELKVWANNVFGPEKGRGAKQESGAAASSAAPAAEAPASSQKAAEPEIKPAVEAAPPAEENEDGDVPF